MIGSPLVVAALFQTIWIVDTANGPGTNFTDLPPSVVAAAHADALIVRPGTYSPFNVSGKALAIRGARSGNSPRTASFLSGSRPIGELLRADRRGRRFRP